MKRIMNPKESMKKKEVPKGSAAARARLPTFADVAGINDAKVSQRTAANKRVRAQTCTRTHAHTHACTRQIVVCLVNARTGSGCSGVAYSTCMPGAGCSHHQ